jgi:hypothetical protein
MMHAIECTQSRKMPLVANPVAAGLAWAAVSILASYLLGEFSLNVSARFSLVLAPIAAFLYFIWAQVYWYTRSDELQQRIQLTIWVHAFVFCMLGAIGLYYVQRAGFFPVSEYPHLEFYGDVLPYAFAAGVWLGAYRAAKRYC